MHCLFLLLSFPQIIKKKKKIILGKTQKWIVWSGITNMLFIIHGYLKKMVKIKSNKTKKILNLIINILNIVNKLN